MCVSIEKHIVTGVEHSKSLFTDLKKVKYYIGIIGGKLGKSSQLFPNEQTKSRMKKMMKPFHTRQHQESSRLQQLKHGSIESNSST